MVFPAVEKQQYVVLMWGNKDNKWHCKNVALWHGCENKMHSY